MTIYQFKKAKQKHDALSDPNDLRRFRIGPLTLLQLMSLLAITGIVLTLVLAHFFA